MSWLHVLLTTLTCWVTLSPPAFAGENSWAGKRILLKRSGIKIGPRDSGQAGPVAELTYMTYAVHQERDGWLEVRHWGTSGWFKKEDAVLLADAVAFFTDRIGANPNDADSYSRRAAAWYELRNYDLAIQDDTEAIRLRPNDAVLYGNRGLAWEMKKEYDRALSDYNEAIRRNPNSAQSYHNRGHLWARKREDAKALADYDEAIRLRPELSKAYLDRGYLRQRRKEFDKALVDFRKVIELDPKNSFAHRGQGDVWRAKNEDAKALACYDEAIRLAPRDVWGYLSRGSCWARKREYAKAYADYDEAIRVSPKSPAGYNARAWLLATCPDPQYRDGKRAVVYALQAGELTNWKDGNYLDTLAAAYAEAGEFDRAVEVQTKALNCPEFAREHGEEARARLALYKARKAYRGD